MSNREIASLLIGLLIAILLIWLGVPTLWLILFILLLIVIVFFLRP